MIICQVVGHVWATKKEERLNGCKLMIVREIMTNQQDKAVFVAADPVGAGIGERVLVVGGSSARCALGSDDIPADSTIVGIIDSLEIEEEQEGR